MGSSTPTELMVPSKSNSFCLEEESILDLTASSSGVVAVVEDNTTDVVERQGRCGMRKDSPSLRRQHAHNTNAIFIVILNSSTQGCRNVYLSYFELFLRLNCQKDRRCHRDDAVRNLEKPRISG